MLMFALLAVNVAWANGGEEPQDTTESGFAEEYNGVTIYYNILTDPDENTPGTVEVTYESYPSYVDGTTTYDFYKGAVEIPETVTHNGTTYDVTGIGMKAFYCTEITSLTIPSSITSIGDADADQYHAISRCYSLKSIKIPASILTMGKYLLDRDYELESIELEDGLSVIGYAMVKCCHSLKEVYIPASVKEMGEYAFSNDSTLASITFGDGSKLTEIPNYAFVNCAITRIEIPENVTKIGEQAFAACENLTTVVLPDGIETIGEQAFACCNNLKTFYSKSSTPPTINANAFALGESNVNDDEDFTYTAGDDPAYLTGMTLYVPEDAVDTYEKSDWATYFSTIKSYTFKDEYGICYEKIIDEEDCVKVVASSDGYSGEITIPSTVIADNVTYKVTQIDDNAFKEVESETTNRITSISLSEGLEIIGTEAFIHCESLTAITIPASVKTIGTGAFDRCYSLATVTFADGSQLEEIGDYVFQMCSITSIVLPASCTTIGYGAFYQNSFEKFEFPEGVEEINFGMFAGCTALKTVTIPSSVTAIDNWVFVNCEALTTINCNSATVPTLGENVFVTGEYDYSQADQLKEVTGYLTGITMYVADGMKYLYQADDAWTSEFTAYENTIDGNALTDDFENSYYYYSVDGEVVLTLTAVGVSDEGVAEISTDYNGEEFVIATDAFAEAEFTELIISWTTLENAIDPSVYFTEDTTSLLTVPEGSEWTYYFSDWSTYFTINATLSFTANDEYGTYTYTVDQTSGTVVLTDFTGGDYIIIESTMISTVNYDENTTFEISSVADNVLSNIVLWVPRGTLGDYSSIEEDGIFKEICETPDLYIDGIYYNFIYSDDEVEGLSLKARTVSLEVTNGPEAYEGDITIPETVSVRSVDLGEDTEVTYEVTSLSSTAFKDCTDLTSVTLESSVPLENADALNQVPESCVIVVEDEATRAAYSSILTSVTVYTEEEYKAIVSGITIKVIDKLERYNLLGQRVNAPVRGINIIKYSDGTVEKVLVK